MKKIITCFVLLLIATIMGVAQEQQPQLGIVNRTQCSGFWRYDFNYTTTDIDE